jgi:hypothetical protein
MKLLIFNRIVHFSWIGVKIEYPSNEHIEERLRENLDLIDPIFRYYIIPHEIQFHANAIQDDLPYFLRCKGSKQSVQFTVPISATKVGYYEILTLKQYIIIGKSLMDFFVFSNFIANRGVYII